MDTSRTPQPQQSNKFVRHRAGVATQLKAIRAEIADLSLAVRAMLAERQSEQEREQDK